MVAAVSKEATGISGGDGLEGRTGGGDQAREGALRLPPQALLDHGEGQLNGVEVRGIAGQKAELTAGLLNQPSCTGALVDGEVVEDDDLPGEQRGQQTLLHIGVEGFRLIAPSSTMAAPMPR